MLIPLIYVTCAVTWMLC